MRISDNLKVIHSIMSKSTANLNAVLKREIVGM